jgi:hypothetical protein
MNARQSGEIQSTHIWKSDVDDHPVDSLPRRLEVLQRSQRSIGLKTYIPGLAEGFAHEHTYYWFVVNDENRRHGVIHWGTPARRAAWSAGFQAKTCGDSPHS